ALPALRRVRYPARYTALSAPDFQNCIPIPVPETDQQSSIRALPPSDTASVFSHTHGMNCSLRRPPQSSPERPDTPLPSKYPYCISQKDPAEPPSNRPRRDARQTGTDTPHTRRVFSEYGS